MRWLLLILLTVCFESRSMDLPASPTFEELRLEKPVDTLQRHKAQQERLESQFQKEREALRAQQESEKGSKSMNDLSSDRQEALREYDPEADWDSHGLQHLADFHDSEDFFLEQKYERAKRNLNGQQQDELKQKSGTPRGLRRWVERVRRYFAQDHATALVKKIAGMKDGQDRNVAIASLRLELAKYPGQEEKLLQRYADSVTQLVGSGVGSQGSKADVEQVLEQVLPEGKRFGVSSAGKSIVEDAPPPRQIYDPTNPHNI